MAKDFWKNKNVVITGGSSGLGKQLALQLAARGAKVAVIARDRERLHQLAEMDPRILVLAGDVSAKSQVFPLAGEIQSRLGDVDVLIHNASYLGETPLRTLVDTNCEDFAKVLETNLIGPFRLTKALIPSMILQKKGLVVNISSDAAVSAYPRWGAYSVSKAASDHLTRIFRSELEHSQVRFVAIDPGDMATPMHFAAIPDANPADLRQPEDSASRIIHFLAQETSLPERWKA